LFTNSDVSKIKKQAIASVKSTINTTKSQFSWYVLVVDSVILEYFFKKTNILKLSVCIWFTTPILKLKSTTFFAHFDDSTFLQFLHTIFGAHRLGFFNPYSRFWL
jgi:hypothetical protein